MWRLISKCNKLIGCVSRLMKIHDRVQYLVAVIGIKIIYHRATQLKVCRKYQNKCP